jgi:hypothetical protein
MFYEDLLASFNIITCGQSHGPKTFTGLRAVVTRHGILNAEVIHAAEITEDH